MSTKIRIQNIVADKHYEALMISLFFHISDPS